MSKLWDWLTDNWGELLLLGMMSWVVWSLVNDRKIDIKFQMNNCPAAGKPDIRQSYKI